MLYLINNYHLSRLSNTMCCQALTSIIKCLQNYDLIALLIENESTDLINKVHAFNQLVLQPKRSSETEKLQQLKKQRDQMIIGLNSLIDPYLTHHDKEKHVAAHKIRSMIDSYGKRIYRQSYQETSTTLSVIIRKLETESYASICLLLGLEEWIKDLKECNLAFIDLYDARDLHNSSYVEGSTQKARSDAQQSFYTLCDMINSHAKISGIDLYQKLVQEINEIVSQTKIHSHHKKSQKHNKNLE